MINIKSTRGKFVAFTLVRDKNGNPKVDDPQNLPVEIFKAFSDEDVKFIYGNAQLPEHLKNVTRNN